MIKLTINFEHILLGLGIFMIYKNLTTCDKTDDNIQEDKITSNKIQTDFFNHTKKNIQNLFNEPVEM
ncbi:MAG: hypothetical protein QXL94_00835 [Candidatus Parvarchaeum sp.]